MTKNFLIDVIDDILPQTQCGLCSYGGCRPYAEAIVHHNEAINRCPPGGVATLLKLGSVLHQNVSPHIAEMNEKAKPPTRAYIRESECIGCTKCIQACPVDAIIGSAKKMHTVISDECTGCDLCLEPCPVDCIEMIPLGALPEGLQKRKSDKARTRFQQRNQRLLNKTDETTLAQPIASVASRKTAIEEALARVKLKKVDGHDT